MIVPNLSMFYYKYFGFFSGSFRKHLKKSSADFKPKYEIFSFNKAYQMYKSCRTINDYSLTYFYNYKEQIMKLIKVFGIVLIAIALSSCDENIKKVEESTKLFVDAINSKDKAAIFDFFPSFQIIL